MEMHGMQEETLTVDVTTDQRPACFGRDIPLEREAIRLCATCAVNGECLDAFDAPGSAARTLPMMWPTPVVRPAANGNGTNGHA
jgi:hypothetical protein